MTKKNTGKEFELLAESIFNKLIKNPDYESVQQNVFVNGIDGKRQIDVLISSEIAGIEIRTVIECKDFNTKISVGKIDEFHSKLMDINANKGIFISRKGFSSTALNKANRLGITLCTAHEALKPSWSIDFDIPLIIEISQPTNYQIKYKINVDAGDTTDEPHTVNDINILDEIRECWPKKELEFKYRKGLQKIELKKIKPPLFKKLANKSNVKRDITDLNILLEIETNCFFLPLSKVKNTQILNNLSDKKTTFFMDIKSIIELSDNFIKIKCNTNLKKIGVQVELLITPDLKQQL